MVLRVGWTQLISYLKFFMHLWLGLESCDEAQTGWDLQMASSFTCPVPRLRCLELLHGAKLLQRPVLREAGPLTPLLASH